MSRVVVVKKYKLTKMISYSLLKDFKMDFNLTGSQYVECIGLCDQPL